jgi:hypothetical protein
VQHGERTGKGELEDVAAAYAVQVAVTALNEGGGGPEIDAGYVGGLDTRIQECQYARRCNSEGIDLIRRAAGLQAGRAVEVAVAASMRGDIVPGSC